jgi:hypothetical protein
MTVENLDSAEVKAWEYFRQLLNDDSKFVTIRLQKKPIEVLGSEGGRYFLYPSGQVVDLDDQGPKLGRALRNEMPDADLLSSLYVWITQKEAEFKREWKCGNLDVFYRQNPRVTDNTLWENEYVRRAFGHRESIFHSFLKFLPATLMVPLIIIIVIQVIPAMQNIAQTGTISSSSFNNIIVTVIPLIFSLFVIIVLYSILRTTGDF